MEVALAAVGRLKSGAESELCALYLDRARRAGRQLGFRGFSTKEVPELRATRQDDRAREEAEAICGLIGGPGRVICLDEAGDLVDSKTFAAELSRSAGQSLPRTTFVIGGPDGLGPPVLSIADGRMSLGRMTFPHRLARILLAEQLYRAMTILSGHPYHRG